jgi:hypothetical protein
LECAADGTKAALKSNEFARRRWQFFYQGKSGTDPEGLQ